MLTLQGWFAFREKYAKPTSMPPIEVTPLSSGSLVVSWDGHERIVDDPDDVGRIIEILCT